MNWTEANGVSLRYEAGGPDQAPVVLVHELGGTLDSWDYTLPALQQHFRTLRYDQRGCGLSEKIRGTVSLDTMVADLLGLLDGLGIAGRCHLIGAALGAAIAIAFAARHPDRVARLIACNPATGVSADNRARLEERASAVERGGMRTFVETSLNNSYPEIVRQDRARFDAYRLRWIANDPFSFAAINRMLGDMDMSADFGRVQCPTLVLGGTHDRLRSAEMVANTARAIPGARLVEIDTGHFMAVQTPELFLAQALPFLRAG
jgi:3-oxoadipate enol-lactonase